jgi:hypothetical protein
MEAACFPKTLLTIHRFHGKTSQKTEILASILLRFGFEEEEFVNENWKKEEK